MYVRIIDRIIVTNVIYNSWIKIICNKDYIHSGYTTMKQCILFVNNNDIVIIVNNQYM